MLKNIRIYKKRINYRKIQYIPFVFLFILSTVSSSLLSAPLSQAASAWDGMLQPISSLHIQYGDDNRDISSTYVSLIHDHCTTSIYNRFVDVMNSGVWTIKEDRSAATPYQSATVNVTFWLSKNPSASMGPYDFSGRLGFLQTGIDSDVTLSLNGQPGEASVVCGGSAELDIGAAYFAPSYIYASNWPITYPADYAGVYISSTLDADGDGLTNTQERSQDTSDTDMDGDTDNDGLSDLAESVWNPYRDTVFCNTSTVPYVCAYPNPTTKDLYVEVDWVNDGVVSYKPTNTQIGKVVSTFADQGIIAHLDTGQYGGGNQLPALNKSLIFLPTDDEVDFYDLKNGTLTETANFESDRQNIWHYMITGANFMADDEDTLAQRTGASFPGDDDSIVSLQRIESLNPSDLDTAIAGTMLHELGHNLCLSSQEMYSSQAAECVYGEIDKEINDNPSINYDSVMNYRYQLTQADYSAGTNGNSVDHDDWSAIELGLNDFTSSSFEGGLVAQSRSLRNRAQDSYFRMREALQD